MISEALKAKIIAADINETISFGNEGEYLTVRFDHDNIYGYCWTAYTKRCAWKAVFPLRGTHTVAYFKKLAGAKRNFLRRLEK